MGFVSFAEDIQRRLDECTMLSDQSDPVAGNEVKRMVHESRELLRRLKEHLEAALEYITDPTFPREDPAEVQSLRARNDRLELQLGEERRKRDLLRDAAKAVENRLTQVLSAQRAAEARAVQLKEENEFLRAMGGERILAAGSKRRKGSR